MGKLVRKAAVVATVLDALVAATKVERKKDEDFNDFVERVCEAGGALPDSEFDKLPKASRDYFNAAVDAINKETKVPEPAPLKGGAKPEPEKEEVKEEKEEKSNAKKGKTVTKKAEKKAEPKKAEKPAKAKAEAKVEKKSEKPAKAEKAAKAEKPAKKAKKEAGPRTESVATKIRQAVVDKPDIEYSAACKKAGVEESPHAYSLYAEAVVLVELKKSKKAREEAAASEKIGMRIRAVVASAPEIEFEAACKEAGAKAKEAKPGSYLWNRWNQSRQLFALM